MTRRFLDLFLKTGDSQPSLCAAPSPLLEGGSGEDCLFEGVVLGGVLLVFGALEKKALLERAGLREKQHKYDSNNSQYSFLRHLRSYFKGKQDVLVAAKIEHALKILYCTKLQY